MAYQIYKLLLLLTDLYYVMSAAATGPLSETLDDYIEIYTTVSRNTRLMGNNLSVTTRSFLQCGVTCSISEDCSGVNFCNNTCELLFSKSTLVPSGKTESCWISLILQLQETETTGLSLTSEEVVPSTTPFSCPATFTKIGNGCYTVAEEKTGLAYTNAIELCQGLNASLASLEALEELNSLQEYLTNLYPLIQSSVSKSWLIGAYQNNSSGTFFWLSGAKVVGDIWAPDEPDKPEQQDCVSLRADEGFKLVSVYCGEYNRQYICEL
ncbi:low affinity immunoglobulin epsilon Fc receptor-like [Liolophura sinensis]|uniref:low affinity immunoglobulin epsilon Fc receptor-like n=1 Tax=Liolophura sinensis TaxID=3198878 RepID=UPI0031588C73